MRWEGQGAKIIRNGFKIFWSESCKAENWCRCNSCWLIGKVVPLERLNDRVKKVNIIIGHIAWEIMSCYLPQAARLVNKK